MKRTALLVLFLAGATSAHAWTLAGDRRIAAAAAKLGPADLFAVIKKFNVSFANGIANAAANEPQDGHGANLGRLINAETKKVITMLRTNEKMSVVVEQLGILAHLVGDANNPFHGANASASQHADFEHYFEARMRKFPLVYYGSEPIATLVDRALSRTANFRPLLAEEYRRGTSETFDDHSTAFGVASVCYSHAVSDTANLYTYIWREAGGVVLNAKN